VCLCAKFQSAADPQTCLVVTNMIFHKKLSNPKSTNNNAPFGDDAALVERLTSDGGIHMPDIDYKKYTSSRAVYFKRASNHLKLARRYHKVYKCCVAAEDASSRVKSDHALL